MTENWVVYNVIALTIVATSVASILFGALIVVIGLTQLPAVEQFAQWANAHQMEYGVLLMLGGCGLLLIFVSVDVVLENVSGGEPDA